MALCVKVVLGQRLTNTLLGYLGDIHVIQHMRRVPSRIDTDTTWLSALGVETKTHRNRSRVSIQRGYARHERSHTLTSFTGSRKQFEPVRSSGPTDDMPCHVVRHQCVRNFLMQLF